MNKLLLLFVCTLTHFGFAQVYETVEDVPDPKKNGQGYLSNPDGILSAETELEINVLLAQLEERDSFQVAVVCLHSIGDLVPKDFATDLFNHWGVGLSDKDNGLLVLFVEDQRRIEFETGYGMETVLTDVDCDNIMVDYMVPEFKRGDYDKGFIRGMNAVSNHLNGKVIDSYVVPEESDEYRYLGNYEYEYPVSPPFYERTSFWLAIAGWQLIYVIAFLVVLLIARANHDPYKKYNLIKYFDLWIWFLLFPLAHLLLFKLAKGLKSRYRNTIRFSGKTGEIMHKLDDKEEDTYLNSGQLTEEIVRSVDYDVWITDGASDVTILPYRPFFSKYTKCPKCGFSTYYKEYDRTIAAATTSSSGTGERKHSCAHCKHAVVSRYTIPRISKSSSTSFGGWSGGGSRSGGWSGGGSSWGGGRSGGGGAGRSW